MPASLTTGGFGNFLEGLGKPIEVGLRNLMENSIYTKYMEVRKASQITERDFDIENMGAVQSVPEGAPLTQLNFSEGYPQAYTQHVWGGMVEITVLLKKFAKFEFVSRLTKQLMNATYKAKELIGAAYLEEGDTAAASVPLVAGLPFINVLGGDGLTLFNTAHTWVDGSDTYPNQSAAADSLTEAAFDTAWTRVMRQADNTGYPLDHEIIGIIIPPDLYSDAVKVFESKLEPATANNAVNVAPKQTRGGVIQNKLLTSTSRWYIQTDAKEAGLIWWEGIPDTVVTNQPAPRTLNESVQIYFSCAHGANRLLNLYLVG